VHSCRTGGRAFWGLLGLGGVAGSNAGSYIDVCLSVVCYQDEVSALG
jgi:hypothetical protein